jgi:hypothetical protein
MTSTTGLDRFDLDEVISDARIAGTRSDSDVRKWLTIVDGRCHCFAHLIMDRPNHLKLELGSRISGKQHSCGAQFDSVPLLVPPT